MRKKYIKPNLMVESFTLTQSIALNCGPDYAGADKASDVGLPLLKDASSCAFDFSDGAGGMVFFLNSVDACTNLDECGDEVSIETIDDYNAIYGEAYCYQAPNSELTVFDS